MSAEPEQLEERAPRHGADERGVPLTHHLAIHVLELDNWRLPVQRGGAVALADLEQWMYFLKEARRWRALPSALTTPPLEEAMSVLNAFSEKKDDYLRYKSRLNFLRDQAEFREGLAEALEQVAAERAEKEVERAAREVERTAKEAERTAKEAERTAKEAALAGQEAERAAKEAALQREAALRARLRAAGLDPDLG